jgi:hypothetical protein
MAIASPKAPKNPYTNLPWSIGQLVVLYDQMHRVLWQTGGHFMDTAAQAFYSCGFSLKAFHTNFGDQLDRECAKQFFHDITSEYWDILYGDTLSELLTMIHAPQKVFLKALIMDRSLPQRFLIQWNDLLYGFWSYENLGRMVLPDICTIYDLLEQARELLKNTIAHVRLRRSKTAAPS